MNPPYGGPSIVGPWMARLSHHGRGTALIFARTETKIFFETVWQRADAVLFLKGRLQFHRPDGSKPRADQGGGNSGAPSVLVAYGDDDAAMLERCGLPGQFLRLKGGPIR